MNDCRKTPVLRCGVFAPYVPLRFFSKRECVMNANGFRRSGRPFVKISLLFFQILLRRRQHQFNTVQLVYFRSARIIVDGYDIGTREFMTYFFDHTFTYYMVWKAGKWLRTDDICNTLLYKLKHLAC